jgi:hypothetical protein
MEYRRQSRVYKVLLIIPVQVIQFLPDFLQVRRGVDHRRFWIVMAGELRECGERNLFRRLIEKRVAENVGMDRSFFEAAAVIQPGEGILDIPDTDSFFSVRDKQGRGIVLAFIQVFRESMTSFSIIYMF